VALTDIRRWLIAYDIRERRRLARMHAAVKKVGVPVQYSLFAARGSTAAVRRLAPSLERLIDTRVDDVRIYPVPDNPLVCALGRTMLPDDILLLDSKADVGAILGRKRVQKGEA
jgi:CRISPR-associated protein Cas2